jgi:hypothetical protein
MKKHTFPIVLVWHDKTIDVTGVEKLVVPGIYIRKGRTLTIKGVDPLKRFEMQIAGPMIIRGDVRLAKTAQEMTVEQLREITRNNNEEES